MLLVNDTQFPVVYILASGNYSEEDALAYCEAAQGWIRRAEAAECRYHFFGDALGVEAVSPLARKTMADFEASLTEAEYGRLQTRLVVSSSLVVRGAITAMSWFTPRMKNIIPAKSLDEGLDLFGKALRDAKLETPAGFEQIVRDAAKSAVG